MTLMIPPGFGNARFSWSLAGDDRPMGFSIGLATSGAAGAFQTLADDLADDMIADIPPGVRSASYAFKGVVLYVGQDGAPPLIFEAPRNSVGTSDTETLPQNCSVLVHKRTATGGRRGRGRMFVPPFRPLENAVGATGVITAAALATIQGWFTTLYGQHTWFLLHDNGTLLPPAPTAITSFQVDPIIATQRRRLRR